MELTYALSARVDKHGNPSDAYVLVSENSGQYRWVADTEFGPFDSWIDLVGWLRRQVSVDMDARFT